MSEPGAKSDYITPLETEARLTIRLADAGEKAGDADRVMRAINSLILLYSASAQIIRKPTAELQILGIAGVVDRDVTVLGDLEAIQTVKAVVESIPDAVADIHPEDEIDIHELVYSFPIFDDLQELESADIFSPLEFNEIKDRMYRGVLLSLESGFLPTVDEAGDMSSTQPSGTWEVMLQHVAGVESSHSENSTQASGNVDIELQL